MCPVFMTCPPFLFANEPSAFIFSYHNASLARKVDTVQYVFCYSNSFVACACPASILTTNRRTCARLFRDYLSTLVTTRNYPKSMSYIESQRRHQFMLTLFSCVVSCQSLVGRMHFSKKISKTKPNHHDDHFILGCRSIRNFRSTCGFNFKISSLYWPFLLCLP